MTKRHAWVAAVVGLLAGFAQGPARAADATTFDGRPEYKEGADRGYYVWRDGNEWHVRWTTMGIMRRFSGSVVAEGGDLESLHRVDVEQERTVIARGRAPHVYRGRRGRLRVAPGRRAVVATREQDKIEKDGNNKIWFIANTDDDIDGFDFKVDDKVRTLRFVLEIDGASPVTEVEVGRKNAQPGSNPFVVQLR